MPSVTKRVNDWLLIGNLGQGGFGEVQHWRNQSTNQEVATKHIKNVDGISADQQRKLKDRWMQEYQWTRDFQQLPNIVAGVNLSSDSEDFVKYLNSRNVWQLPVIILQYCNGGDVRKLLQRPQNANGLVEHEVRQIMRCLRNSVDFLHNKCDICHRDLKPDNIVIHNLPDGTKLYKLTDFGLARNAPAHTIVQSVVGTRHYYAPEVVDSGKYNKKVDYWSIGVILYEVATGVLPFIPHQTAFVIHVNLKDKKSNCIAISEDANEKDRFHYHDNLHVMHHLSQPFSVELTKVLRLALDTNYSTRGMPAATDEVQRTSCFPILFQEMDRVLNLKILTLFVACKFMRLEYVVTDTMTLPELGALITKDTGLAMNSMYLVLPTGHPHHRITQETTPMNLYVEEWCDTSEGSRKPPVMVFVFNFMERCEYTAPVPCMTPLIRNLTTAHDMKPPNWVVDRMVLDLHYMLTKEHEILKMLLFGFEQYAMQLEDEILHYQTAIKALETEKYKRCGAIEHFEMLISTAQQQLKYPLINNEEWELNRKKMIDNFKNIDNSIGLIIHHYESSLRSIRERAIKHSPKLYEKFIDGDVYKIKHFRKYDLYRDNFSCSALSKIAFNYINDQYAVQNDSYIKMLGVDLNQAHLRYRKILLLVPTAYQNMKDIQSTLLNLQLQLLSSPMTIQQPSVLQLNHAMNALSFDSCNGESSLMSHPFDSLSTENVIEAALSTCQLMESSMDVEHE